MWEYKIHNFLTLCLWPRFLLREILTFTKVVGSVLSHVSHWKLPPLFIWLGQGFIKSRGQNPVAEHSIKRFELESRLHLWAWLLLNHVITISTGPVIVIIILPHHHRLTSRQLRWWSTSSDPPPSDPGDAAAPKEIELLLEKMTMVTIVMMIRRRRTKVMVIMGDRSPTDF